MSMPYRHEPGSPESWIEMAQSDLALAQTPVQGAILRKTLAFHAQQAIEKAIKAVCVAKNAPFPYTHNLVILSSVLHEKDIECPVDSDTMATISQYAVEMRYPGVSEDLDEELLQHALRAAVEMIDWAETICFGEPPHDR